MSVCAFLGACLLTGSSASLQYSFAGDGASCVHYIQSQKMNRAPDILLTFSDILRSLVWVTIAVLNGIVATKIVMKSRNREVSGSDESGW